MALFKLGQVTMTNGAVRAFNWSGDRPDTYLDRHVRGDYGEATAQENWDQNDYAIKAGLKVFSHYLLSDGTGICVWTDREREWTHIVLEEE